MWQMFVRYCWRHMIVYHSVLCMMEHHPHYELIIHKYLDVAFDEWFGQCGATEWPARYCDIKPCDFFLWGLLKICVFTRYPHTLLQLRTYIEEEFENLRSNLEVVKRTCHSVIRCHACVAFGRHHCERLE